MKTVVGVYNTHNEAIEAVKELKAAGYTNRQISIIGKIEDNVGKLEEDDDRLIKVAGTEVGVATVAGTTIGILTGLGIFAIPGLGFLYGAGALVGAIAGFDFGLIGGGIISALTIPGMKDETAKQYESELQAGKILVIMQGNEEDVKKASETLTTHGRHTTLDTH